VKKPTVDGMVTSLETFDAHGELIAQFFGARKPGIPEKPEWRDLVDTVMPDMTGTRQ
jgi:putative hemin transport protein